MKVALVVGHAKDKQGAVGSEGISEYIFWRTFLKEHIEDFPKNNIYKIFYRPTSKKGYGSRMAALHQKIDAWGADVSVSFHFNASSNPGVNGHEVLYCSESGRTNAKLLNDCFTDYLDNHDRGIKRRTKKERGGGFLCRGKSVCVLAEPFFASHQYKYTTGHGKSNLFYAFSDFFDSL